VCVCVCVVIKKSSDLRHIKSVHKNILKILVFFVFHVTSCVNSNTNLILW
jgi:hypothetical protein